MDLRHKKVRPQYTEYSAKILLRLCEEAFDYGIHKDVFSHQRDIRLVKVAVRDLRWALENVRCPK